MVALRRVSIYHGAVPVLAFEQIQFADGHAVLSADTSDKAYYLAGCAV